MMTQLEQKVVADVKKRFGAVVARSTKRFLSARRELGKCTLDYLVAMGRELIAVKKKLKHGQWLSWVHKDLGTEVKTAERMIDVAQAYKANSTTLSNFESLDASRLYRLARVSNDKLRQLSPEMSLPVKPGGALKPLASMTFVEFDAALDLYDPPKTGRSSRSRGMKPTVPGIALPSLDQSNRDANARSHIAAIKFLRAEASRIRALPGKLSADLKEEMEVEVENLRKEILGWPAWAKKHR